MDVPTSEILEVAGLRPGEAALVVGGPPCTPFSKSARGPFHRARCRSASFGGNAGRARLGEELPPVSEQSTFAHVLALGDAYPDSRLGIEVAYEPRRILLGFGLMAVAGVVSGLLGIGSGALKVLAMDGAMRLPMKVSSATSNFMIGVTAAASPGSTSLAATST